MTNPIKNLNKIFESRIRLGIMSALMVNKELSYNALKSLLELTDGNLASHMKALEKVRYVHVRKQFIGRKPNTSYQVSNQGQTAFNTHLSALESLIKNSS